MPTKILSELNFEQRQVVYRWQGPLLVLAPVGTGKTRVMAHRAAVALKKGVKPREMLLLSFTNRACREMEKRVFGLLGEEAGMMIKTFHGFCAEILRRDGDYLGIARDFVIYDEEDVLEAAHILRKKLGINLSTPQERRDFERFFLDFIKKVKESYLYNKETSVTGVYYALLGIYNHTFRQSMPLPEILFNSYQEYLEANHALDFNDLIVKVIELFSENVEVYKAWQKRFSWIQVDEVQDTNLLEYFLIKKLAKEHQNLAFFGDLDQTIYEWRDSRPYDILEDFRLEFKPIEYRLKINYRFTENLRRACESVIRAYDEAVTTEICGVSKEIGEKVYRHRENTLQDEAAWIAGKIRELKEKGVCSLKNIAILTRTNKTLAEISKVLEREKIPHYLVEQFKFFRRTEIKDVLAYLRFLLNSNDSQSLIRVLKRPARGIGEATMEEILRLPRELGLKLADFANPRILYFLDIYDELVLALKENKLVIFDVETTGLNLAGDEIIEIAGLKVGEKGVVDFFHEYLKNTKPVRESEKIHGISDDFLAIHGKPHKKVLEEFLKFTRGCLLVGHNVSFDFGMLKSELSRYGLEQVNNSYFDTLELTRRFFELQSYRLEEIQKALGLKTVPDHSASRDVYTTYELLLNILPKISKSKEIRLFYINKYKEKFTALAEEVALFRQEMFYLRPYQLLQVLLERSGYLTYWAKQEDGERRIKNLKELIEIFKVYDEKDLDPVLALHNLLNITALSTDAERFATYEDRVMLLTAHSAKGMEFDTVFIAAAVEGQFPSILSIKEEYLAEEHRLFYVAMTRAKKRLFITYHQRDRFDNWELSRFVKYIPKDVLEEI